MGARPPSGRVRPNAPPNRRPRLLFSRGKAFAVHAEETRCGFCAIVGPTNAGKSTLLNALAGSKLAIVSHKVQTTRSRIRAIVIEANAQIVFVDTPGIFRTRRKLDEAMVDDAWAGAAEA